MAKTWIGHYGCGRLVKVATRSADGEKRHNYQLPKLKHRVECPGCGFTHPIVVQWRKPKDKSEFERAELVL